jgi:aspartate oxidase
MRTMIALSVCCAAAVAAGVFSYSNGRSNSPIAPLVQQVVADQPAKQTPEQMPDEEVQTIMSGPVAILETRPTGNHGATPLLASGETTAVVLAQAPAEMESEAKAKAKAEPKKRAAPTAKKDASDTKKTSAAKTAASGDDLKSIKKELAQARRDRTALDKRIMALEKQVEELEASAANDKPAKGAKAEKSSKDEAPKAEKSKAAPKASAVKRAKPTKADAAA